jgi:hypothetical protein
LLFFARTPSDYKRQAEGRTSRHRASERFISGASYLANSDLATLRTATRLGNSERQYLNARASRIVGNCVRRPVQPAGLWTQARDRVFDFGFEATMDRAAIAFALQPETMGTMARLSRAAQSFTSNVSDLRQWVPVRVTLHTPFHRSASSRQCPSSRGVRASDSRESRRGG